MEQGTIEFQEERIVHTAVAAAVFFVMLGVLAGMLWKGDLNSILIWIAVIAAVICCFFGAKAVSLIPRWAGAIVFAVALILRLAMIWGYPITPVSDFQETFALANQLTQSSDWGTVIASASGGFDTDWAMHVPFILLETLCLKLSGENVLGIQILFGILEAGSCLLCFKIAQRWYGTVPGIWAGLVSAINPILLCYSPVLTNQHAATFFFLLGIWFFLARPISSPWWNAGLTGLSFALSHLIRPEMQVVLIAVICYLGYQLFFFLLGRKKGKSFKMILTGIVILGVFFIAIGLCDVALQKTGLTKQSIFNGNLTYKIAVGLNQDSKGYWNQEDWEIYHDQPELEQRIRERISQPGMVEFMVKKVISQYGTYHYDWAVCDGASPEFRNIFSKTVQSFMFLILLLACVAILSLVRKFRMEEMFLLIVVLGYFITFSIIEVQDRYNYLLIAVFTIFAAKIGSVAESFLARREIAIDK